MNRPRRSGPAPPLNLAGDFGGPLYDVHECAGGQWIALGAVEKKFYAEALRVLGLESLLEDQSNRARWPGTRAQLAAKFKTRTRDEWSQLFEGTESCFAPVLTLDEAPQHPHLRERATYVDIDSVVQPAPAPRFSRSVPATPQAARPWDREQAEDILSSWLDASEVLAARNAGTFG